MDCKGFLLVMAVAWVAAYPLQGVAGDEPVTVTLHLATNVDRSYSFLTGRKATPQDTLPGELSVGQAIVFEKMTPGVLPPVGQGDMKSCSRLWIDLDGSGTFDDGEEIALDHDRGRSVGLPEIRCLVNDGGHEHWVSFKGYLNLYNEEPMLVLTGGLSYEGALDVGDESFSVSVRDDNVNGCVVEFPSDEEQRGTLFCLALQSDPDDLISLPLAKTVGIFSRFYAVDMAVAGTEEEPTLSLTLTPTNVPGGDVKIGGSVKWFSMTAPGISFVTRPNDINVAPLPAGALAFHEVVVEENGQRFKAEQGIYGRTDDLVVQENQTITKKLGGPLKHELTIKGATTTGVLTIEVGETAGVGELVYEPVSREAKERGWLVRSKSGEVIASGQFALG